MATALSSTKNRFAGHSTKVPDDGLFHFCFSNPFQHAPNDYTPASVERPSPEHAFNGQPIPPQRPSLIHAGTGATLSWQRVRADSLRVARYLHAIVGSELPCDTGSEPIHSPRTTVLLHLPNCLPFPLLFLGASAALCTLSPISTALMPAELANILAKARPQVLITTVGADGEDRLRAGLQVLLDRPEQDAGAQSGREVKRWAAELAASWDRGRRQKSEKGSRMPTKEQRVWTVNLASWGGADYYGTSMRGDGVSTLMDPRDWSHLLSPPHGHRHSGTADSLTREAFSVRKLAEKEQARRVALLLWSSGTTGGSKGVLLSHRNIVASICSTWTAGVHTHAATSGSGSGETWIALAPWCHVYGLFTLLLPAFAAGATLVLPASPAFELGNYLRLVTQYRATLMHIAPPVAVALRSTPLLDRTTPEGKAIDLSSVRTMLSGGAPTPVEVIKDIYARTGKMLHIGYGATETGSTSHTAALRPNPSIPDSIEELGSVGEPMSNLEVCIRPNKETTAEQTKALFDDIVAQGELKRRTGQSAPVRPSLAGEVCIRGAAIMLGYYSGLASDEGTGARDAALTSGAMTDDGYYRTGDEGLFDYRGRIWITGRTKELIKVRGFQVPPAELDSLFAKHAEVAEAAATGFVEADGAEQVVMYILPRDQAVLTSDARQRDLVDRLAHFVSDKIARYKWPRYYVFSATVLKNPTGKIMRKDLHTLPGTRHLAPRIDAKM